jgi:hypothetical protein
MGSSSRKIQSFDRKAKIVERLTANWDGIDHPLWRKEAANKIQFVIETLLCIIAMSDDMTPESSAAAAALMVLTEWDEEEFLANMKDVTQKVMLMNEQEGGMQ